MSYYSRNGLLDKNLVLSEIKKMLKIALEIKDIFIITKGTNVLEIYDNAEDVLNFFIKKPISKMKEYELVDYYSFLKDFIKETNKYRTYKNKTVYKYHKTLELGKNNGKKKIEELKKDEKMKMFFRQKKLERVINEREIK